MTSELLDGFTEPSERTRNVPTRAAIRQHLHSYEECCEILTRLFLSALESDGPRAFFDHLKRVRKLAHVSVFNAMMVEIQRPGVELVATKAQWALLGQTPSPRAEPVIILRPFGPLGFLYEQKDVYGSPLPDYIASPFVTRPDVNDGTVHSLASAAQRFGVRVEFSDRYGATRAGLSLVDRDGRGDPETWWRVQVNARLPAASQVGALAHELGRVYCGHLGGHPNGLWGDARATPPAVREVEAEAASWIVCGRLGVEPNSTEYLAPQVLDAALHQVNMGAIYLAANRIEQGIRHDAIIEPPSTVTTRMPANGPTAGPRHGKDNASASRAERPPHRGTSVQRSDYPELFDRVSSAPGHAARFFVVLHEDTYESSSGDGKFHTFHSSWAERSAARLFIDDNQDIYARYHLRTVDLAIDGDTLFYDIEHNVFDDVTAATVLDALTELRGGV